MAQQLPTSGGNAIDNEHTDNDGFISDATTNLSPNASFSHRDGGTGSTPALFHKVKNQKSILALAVSNSRIFAGTQGGELLV